MKRSLPISGLALIAGIFVFLTIWANPGLLASRAAGQGDPQSQLQDNTEQQRVLQRQMGELKNSQNLVHDELEDIDRDMSNLDTRRENTTSELTRKQAQVDLLNESHAQAVNDLSSAQEVFEARLVEWYKSGAGTVVGSIVTKGNLSDFLYALYYTQAIVENDRNTIDFIKEQQGKIFPAERTARQRHRRVDEAGGKHAIAGGRISRSARPSSREASGDRGECK